MRGPGASGQSGLVQPLLISGAMTSAWNASTDCGMAHDCCLSLSLQGDALPVCKAWGLQIIEAPASGIVGVLRSLDAFNRVVGDGVPLAKIFEQRGERRQPVVDRVAAETALRQLVAPGNDVGTGDAAELLRAGDAGEAGEVAHRSLVGAPRVNRR